MVGAFRLLASSGYDILISSEQRRFEIYKVLFAIAILSLAFDVSGAKDFQKYSCSELVTFHNSGDRVGGDTMETATVILALPYSDIGNTSEFINDYDVACPYTGSTAPEVVYSFEALTDWTIDITLCTGSTYDTKLYITDSEGNVIDCNDDACPGYVSELMGIELPAGDTYFFFIDGYGDTSGDYTFDIDGVSGIIPPGPGETCETAIEILWADNQVISCPDPQHSQYFTCPRSSYYYILTSSEIYGNYYITSCFDDQMVDTHVYILDACNGEVIAESDDDDRGCGENGTYNYASTVYFNLDEDNQVIIYWDDHWSTESFNWLLVADIVIENQNTSFGAVKAMFR